MLSVKRLVESNGVSCIPSKYVWVQSPQDSILSESDAHNIPTIDFSRLTSLDPTQRSLAIQQLAHACRHWGFFMVINHGVSERVREGVVRGSEGFFELREEEKGEYQGGEVFDPIRCGTSFNLRVDKSLFWRDYLKLHVHPHFHAPTKPSGFSEVLEEYCKRSREVVGELLKGISISLGLEENYIGKKMSLELGFQFMVINFYPRCPKPNLAIGLPPHTDHGLLTLLMQNDLCGLQIQHNGKWVPVHPLPNSFLVNIGDNMEILSNGRYKSAVHRAVVNEKAARISVGTSHGPPLDAIVEPAPELLCEDHPPAFRAIPYRDYLHLQHSHQLRTNSCLDRIRL